MTKHQRAQVVELLRCAADCNALASATEWLEPAQYVWALAYQARIAVDEEAYQSKPVATYAHRCLEAAQRVEEGSWP